MTNITKTDEILEEYFEKGYENTLREIDLMEANPDIAERLGARAKFTIYLSSFHAESLDNQVVFAVQCDDGSTDDDSVEFYATREAGDEAYENAIMEWKYNWGLTSR